MVLCLKKRLTIALWKVPINNKTFNSGLIGVVTNHDVIIRLKRRYTRQFGII